MTSITKPANQTNEEWLDEYETRPRNTVLPPQAIQHVVLSNDDAYHKFRYVGHRTTRLGSVVLEFETLDYKQKAVRFFNVSLAGKNGKKYPAEDRGQFNPPGRGSFRCFWMQVIGKPPCRWSRTHKTMRSSFKGLVFVGKVERAIDNSGQAYLKIVEIWRE